MEDPIPSNIEHTNLEEDPVLPHEEKIKKTGCWTFFELTLFGALFIYSVMISLLRGFASAAVFKIVWLLVGFCVFKDLISHLAGKQFLQNLGYFVCGLWPVGAISLIFNLVLVLVLLIFLTFMLPMCSVQSVRIILNQKPLPHARLKIDAQNHTDILNSLYSSGRDHDSQLEFPKSQYESLYQGTDSGGMKQTGYRFDSGYARNQDDFSHLEMIFLT